MAVSSNNDLKQVRQRQYYGRDFDGFRSLLLDYARRYYADNLQDFSETGLGGMFLDMAAYVGDVTSFYLDHQYSELDPESAVELPNIERHLRRAGIKISGASPSIVNETFYVEVPALNSAPDPSALPIIKSTTVLQASSGTEFSLLTDIDFTATDAKGNLLASSKIGKKNASGPLTYILTQTGDCISGKETSESYSLGTQFVPFRQITLGNPNVTQIISVTDDLGNIYYEVGALTHDVVYKNVANDGTDAGLVESTIKVIPAPYRFTSQCDLASRHITLTFGGATAESLQDDIIPDPSTFALSLPYTTTFSRLSVNPEQMLSTKTLGVIATNTTLTIKYRYGGGLSDNAPIGTVKDIKSLNVVFPNNPTATAASRVRGSIEVSNVASAKDGENALTVDDLRALIPSARNSQERMVTREDMIARIYTMPANFGRVFRASVRSNPNNPMSMLMYIISRDSDGHLVMSSDSLKENVRKYMTPYRLVTDAIDILDARIINVGITFDVVIDPTLNKSTALQNVLSRLNDYFTVTNFHIDMPIVMSEVESVIFQTQGIMSINNIEVRNISNTFENRSYSLETFNVARSMKQRIVMPPPGGIFEVKYPQFDIIGKAVS